MPKKKSKTKDTTKKPIATETNEYQLITLDENHLEQIKHENLIQRVWKTAVSFDEIEQTVKENQKAENITKEWQTYLSCDKIPKPSEPQAIRSFFEKSLHFEKEDIDNTFSWTLGIDERSILNQDIDFLNLSKAVLKKDRIDFGPQYDDRICETMEILNRIQDFLENPSKEISNRVLLDIKELEAIVKSKISYYIDNLTYRVLYSEADYMEPIDVTTAEYSFEGQHFDIDLWTFQNVPIHLDPEETKTKAIELQRIKTDLLIPFSVLSQNMVIRGLHCHFDHLSSRARFNKMPIQDESEKNLKICLLKEWTTLKRLQSETKAIMIKERADFDEAMRLKAEEEELKTKEAKNDSKTKKPQKKENPIPSKKISKEPPIVTPDLVPVVWKDFLEHDSQDHSNTINTHHPHKLNLTNGEVNLRQFQILGGIYHINSLSKPRVANTPALIMTWYNPSNKFEYKNPQVYPDISRVDDISKLFEITFELPDCYCHWGEPIPCIFEDFHSPLDNDSCEMSKSLKISSPIIINDLNLHDIFTLPMMYDFLENSIPRIISSFKFPEDFHVEEDDKKTKSSLGRSKATTESEEKNKEIEAQQKLWSFDVQHDPERLFPIFKNVLPVVILPIQGEDKPKGNQPYEYFSKFMSALESIKDSYQNSSFKDRYGNPVQILVEDYDKNIRKPRIASKLVAYKKLEHAKSHGRTSSFKNERDSIGNRQSFEHKPSLKIERKSSVKTSHEDFKINSTRNTFTIKDENHQSEKDEEISSFCKWSTKNVLKTVFKAAEKKITIWTDRLGTFGFAFNRYQHFPFKSWSLKLCEERPDELELKIESAYALFRIYITKNGYKAFVTDFSKILKTRKTFLDIEEPISDLKIFKKKLQEKFLNIFSDPDAVWYVNGKIDASVINEGNKNVYSTIIGDFSEKHLAAELHTYDCISLNASKLKFKSSDWNKKSNRRTMVLALGDLKESEEELSLIRITAEDVMFVEIKEIINEGISELEYVSTWRNLEWYGDLNHLIESNFSDDDSALKNQNIIGYYLRNLLHSIRLLSFS